MLSEQSKLRDEIRKHYDVESRRGGMAKAAGPHVVDALVQKLSTLNSALKHDLHQVTELKHKVAQELKHAEVRLRTFWMGFFFFFSFFSYVGGVAEAS